MASVFLNLNRWETTHRQVINDVHIFIPSFSFLWSLRLCRGFILRSILSREKNPSANQHIPRTRHNLTN
uniref:Uncharacterized protein n=1 Tax=Rhizophora mucronata TaxID=61149 RepID=A0A2P2LLQ5_RHIMU